MYSFLSSVSSYHWELFCLLFSLLRLEKHGYYIYLFADYLQSFPVSVSFPFFFFAGGKACSPSLVSHSLALFLEIFSMKLALSLAAALTLLAIWLFCIANPVAKARKKVVVSLSGLREWRVVGVGRGYCLPAGLASFMAKCVFFWQRGFSWILTARRASLSRRFLFSRPRRVVARSLFSASPHFPSVSLRVPPVSAAVLNVTIFAYNCPPKKIKIHQKSYAKYNNR